MSDPIEVITVTVKIPEQWYAFDYEKRWFDAVMVDGDLDHFMDLDISNINPDMKVYGPDGELLLSL